jgi:hypothetical protein
MARPVATASLTAENTFTDWADIQDKGHISASGISDSTVFVQRSFDEGATVKDVESFTADFEKVIDGSGSRVFYRIGIKTGGYGSDTVVCRVTQ